MDFKKFDPKFDNNYPVQGPEFGDLHTRRDQFIAANRSNYKLEPAVPRNIAGLTLRTDARTPATQKFFIRTGSFERNGFFNFHTPVFNTKLIYLTFFFTYVWGNSQYVYVGMYDEEHLDSFERRNLVYDKLAHRDIPYNRVWSRPC